MTPGAPINPGGKYVSLWFQAAYRAVGGWKKAGILAGHYCRLRMQEVRPDLSAALSHSVTRSGAQRARD